jgi:hypothetical protein
MAIPDGANRIAWLRRLGIYEPPFSDGEPWVDACFACAIDFGDHTPEEDRNFEQLVVANWRSFLLVVSRTPDIRFAIDAVARLGDPDQQARFVASLFERFHDVMRNTPTLDRLARLRTRRTRRLEGRAGRAPDAAYEAEARLEKRVPRREASRDRKR